MVIYKLTNLINDKIYIGQTNNLKERLRHHKNGYKYNHTKDYPICRAIKKYGFDNFKYEIIDTAETRGELDQKEIEWINKLDSIIDNGKGYNLKGGGEGGSHSEYTKLKIGKAQKGKLNHMYGVTGVDNKTSKKVIDISSGIIYDSATICSEKLGLSLSKLCSVCRGTRATTGGKVFRYVDDYLKPIEPTNAKKNTRKKYRIRCIETGEEFDSIKSAGEYFDLQPSNLGLILRKGYKYKTFAGFHWEKIEEVRY